MPAMAKPKGVSKEGRAMMDRLVKEARRRRAAALAMKDSGKTFQEVGDALGVSRQRAKALVDRARDEASG